MGLSAKVRGTDQVSVVFFGDGASSQGVLHESMNLASIWKLPVLFVCENNRYAEATPFEFTVAGASVANRAAGYDMPGISVDGQDVLEMHEVEAQRPRRSSPSSQRRRPHTDRGADLPIPGPLRRTTPLGYRTTGGRMTTTRRADSDCLVHLRIVGGKRPTGRLFATSGVRAQGPWGDREECLEEDHKAVTDATTLRSRRNFPEAIWEELMTDVYGIYG